MVPRSGFKLELKRYWARLFKNEFNGPGVMKY
jgi:hypothetical protein